MASTIWISGDTHFGEAQAISLFQRPFSDVAEMDARLVESLNRFVKKRDVLIHIGDFCGPCADGKKAQIDHAEIIRREIRCKTIRLVRGNHDPKDGRFTSLFEDVQDQISFRHEGDGTRIVLSHYPMRAWRGQLGGSLHMYGHTHGSLEESGRSMDVGVDCWNYAPIQMDHAVEILSARVLSAPGGWIRRQAMRQDRSTMDGVTPDTAD